MKIEQKQTEFCPVVITLESQFEVDYLHGILARVAGGGVKRDFVDEILESLPEEDFRYQKYFSGQINIVE